MYKKREIKNFMVIRININILQQITIYYACINLIFKLIKMKKIKKKKEKINFFFV